MTEPTQTALRERLAILHRDQWRRARLNGAVPYTPDAPIAEDGEVFLLRDQFIALDATGIESSEIRRTGRTIACDGCGEPAGTPVATRGDVGPVPLVRIVNGQIMGEGLFIGRVWLWPAWLCTDCLLLATDGVGVQP